MKIFYFAIAAILISLGLVPGLVLAIPGDTAGSFSMTPSDMILTPLPDLPEEIFFTPFIFPFDLITPHDRAVLMDHATPDLWYIPIPNPEYWIVPALEEDEEIEKSDEYIFQGSITVGPWMPGLDSDIFAAFNSEPINVGPVIEGQVYTMSETAGPCGPPEQMRDPGLLEAFRS